jgi:hypothetical protein
MRDSVQPSHSRFHGLFTVQHGDDGVPRLAPLAGRPGAVPDPATGRPLRVGSVDGPSQAICPACARPGHGGFVSFESDLRLAYACPKCEQFVWLTGA